MSLFLILLAAGDGKRLKTKVPKPYNEVNDRTLLEYSINAFKNFADFKEQDIIESYTVDVIRREIHD